MRADSELGEPGHDFRLGRVRRTEAEHKVEDGEKLGRGSLRLGAQGLVELDGGRGGRGRLAEELRQRLDLVTGLDFLHVFDVVGTEELGPVEDEGEFGLRPDHRLDARRRFAMPIRPGEEETARVIAGRPAADIGEVEGVHVDELERVVAILVDRRHGEHQRFGSEVCAEEGVGRIGIRRLDRLVVRRVDARIVDERVPGRLVFGAAAIDEIGILDAIAVDEREAVDRRFLGDRACFGGRERVSGRGRRSHDEGSDGEAKDRREDLAPAGLNVPAGRGNWRCLWVRSARHAPALASLFTPPAFHKLTTWAARCRDAAVVLD